MTEDDKKTVGWTAGIVGLLVVVIIAAYALGVIPAPPAT